MVYGVSRIALPSSDLGSPSRGKPAFGDRLCDLLTDATITSDAVPGDFVVGPENQLAVPAVERLLASADAGDSPAGFGSAEFGSIFNPLVLFGPTGVGKSHLARGVARHWLAANAGRTGHSDSMVEYLTAIDFARQLRSAREEGMLGELRERLSKVRLLVLEDLDKLPPSIFVQRELRDLVDRLLNAQSAIVVTAQQSPLTMPDLEAGLRDRLSGGLNLRLQLPGVETRRELLRLAASQRGVALADDQVSQLAQRVEGTASQLFRAVAELELEHAVEGSHGGPQLAAASRPGLKFKQILGVVARYFSLTQAALCSPARRKSLVYARGVAIHLARSLTDLSYAQIGQHLGRRDHTTVMHASRSIENRLATDASTQQDITELKRILTSI